VPPKFDSSIFSNPETANFVNILIAFLLVHAMELQGTVHEGHNVNPPAATGGRPNVAPIGPTFTLGINFHSQRPNIPPPFVQGFHGMRGQLPFLFHHPFMTPNVTPGFAPPTHDIPTSPIDLTGGSHKQAPEECITGQSKPPAKKRKRIQKKKPKIVELDDIKDEGDVQKNIGHWKDHWVIQLITVRGEIHTIFNALPKQGTFLQS
jgi:hypothetical protein